ncbi:MAG: methyltransferase domain-containing protein [Candidatus Rokuibacteriota bacterium]
MVRSRLRFALGVQPLSQGWGDRGQPLHRDYLEHFLQEFSADIRGHCLEFDEDRYASRFGGSRRTKLDVLHREPGNPRATLIADLTEPNDIPSNLFDCIICTYVLHVVFDFRKMVGELHRLLKPRGVLLVAVPDITMCYPYHHELWRFTAEGLGLVLAEPFRDDNVMVRSYGNSLTAAGWLRGLVGRDFTEAERAHHDPRFAMLLCARAVKP